jgi:hypothetical protein
VTVAQAPMLPSVSPGPAFRLSKEIRPRHGFNGSGPGGSQDVSINMQGDDDVPMRIGQSIGVDGTLESIESFEKGVYGTPC